MDLNEPVDLKFCQSLPKIEIHAHLSGSISPSKLIEIITNDKNLKIDYKNACDLILKGDRSLSECFQVFDIIHSAITSKSILYNVTQHVIQSFKDDNVIYLELRTTPRNLNDCSKREYISTVISAANSFTECIIRFILSIDRAEDLDSALNTVLIAKEYMDQGVVGIDLCGNPHLKNFSYFLPALHKARSFNLKITSHVGELPNRDIETANAIQFRPDRIGHGIVLNDSNFNSIVELKIPIEICATSNIFTRACPNISRHIFGRFIKLNHPMAICSDDSGVFGITTATELFLLATTFRLNRKDIHDFLLRSIDTIFTESSIKKKLSNIINEHYFHI